MSLKNWLEETDGIPMTEEQSKEAFNTWFKEEGKFQVPQGDYEAIKKLLLVAWLKGAHRQRYWNI